MSQPTQDIAITAQPTANPQVCTFTVDRTLHEGPRKPTGDRTHSMPRSTTSSSVPWMLTGSP